MEYVKLLGNVYRFVLGAAGLLGAILECYTQGKGICSSVHYDSAVVVVVLWVVVLVAVAAVVVVVVVV
jgi:hypothetical protein